MRSKRVMVLLCVLLLALPAIASAEGEAERLAEMLEGMRLEGQFSVISPEGESPPQADLYMVSELEPGEADVWTFVASMSYGGNEATPMRIPVEVLWAGDTPVLTMTEQAIEGMGRFTVRLLIHGDRYAGTWQNGPIGGHMWGRLVPMGEAPGASAQEDER